MATPMFSASDKFTQACQAGQEALDRSPEDFQQWVQEWIPQLTDEDRGRALWQIVGSGQSLSPEQETELKNCTTFRDVARKVLRFLWLSEKLEKATQLQTHLTAKTEIGTYFFSAQDIKELLIEMGSELERRGRLKLAITLREQAFEIDTTDVGNALSLVFYYSLDGDDFSAAIYARSASEAITPEQTRYKPQVSNTLGHLYQKGQYDVFLDLAEAYIKLIPSQEQAGIYAILAQIARVYTPDRYDDYQNLWQLSDLSQASNHGFISMVKAFVPAAEGFMLLSDSLEPGTFSSLEAMASAASQFGMAGSFEQMKSTIDRILLEWPLERVQVESSLDKGREGSEVAFQFLFPIAWKMGYCSDDMALMRGYVRAAAAAYSDHIHKSYPELYQAGQNRQTSSWDGERPIRVGYLCHTFHGHSVGYLTHQTLGMHNPYRVESFLYYYESNAQDKIRNLFESNAQHFRSFYNLPMPDIVEKIRQDDLDILVYMDNGTNVIGAQIVAMRVAPIQMCWLGADSLSIPETEYFLVDPYLLPEEAQVEYTERLLKLPAFCAADSFEVSSIDLIAFRETLEIPDTSVVFWTAAIGFKRNPDCIERQLEILRRVPNSILIIKGLSDVPTLARAYERIATQKGVEKQLRFLERTTSEETHRAHLGIIDIILDTFPYTGATHTMEALWRGVPVLTQVGRHYYSRMSYSIISNIGGMEDCIAFSGEEYIEKGVRLGLDQQLRRQLRQRLKDTRKSATIWNARRQAQSLEAAYRWVMEGNAVEGYVATPEVEPSEEYPSADAWNRAGIQNHRTGQALGSSSGRRTAWEKALSCWRKGLELEPSHLPCQLNRIFVRQMLADFGGALQEAIELFIELRSTSLENKNRPEPMEFSQVLVWLPMEFSTPKQTPQWSYQYILVRWIAEHLGVMYLPDASRFWQLALNLNDDDNQSRMVIALNQFHHSLAEGSYHLERILAQDPTHKNASVAYEIFTQSLRKNQVRGWLEPPHLSETAAIVEYEGYQLHLESSFSSIGTLVLLAQGKWFEDEIEFCRQWLKPGMTVIDAGANIGVYTFLAAQRVGLTGKVYAIEPTVNCVTCLRSTVQSNHLTDQVSVIEAAVGEKMGEVFLASTGASVFNQVVANRGEAGIGPVKAIRQITLDWLWQSEANPPVHFVKIDTEGVELQTLRGGEAMLRAHHPLILFENMGESATGKPVAEYLETLGYRFYRYNRELNEVLPIYPQEHIVNILNIIAAVDQPQL